MKPSPALQYFTTTQWRGIKFLLVLLWATALYRVGEAWLMPPEQFDFQAYEQQFKQQFQEIRDSSVTALPQSASAASKNELKEKAASGKRINLNSATAEQLITLPRVGPATAQRILDYRRQHGAFKKVRDLVKVRGIGPKTLEKLRPLVRVE